MPRIFKTELNKIHEREKVIFTEIKIDDQTRQR